jgi:hypothetical protein
VYTQLFQLTRLAVVGSKGILVILLFYNITIIYYYVFCMMYLCVSTVISMKHMIL